jgi:hypothetical protein
VITSLPENERAWLQTFFSAPNGLTWEDLAAGAARQDQIDAVTPWLSRLNAPPSDRPLILPFYRGHALAGWYATAQTDQGQQALRSTLKAWFGSSYLTVLQPAPESNPSAAAMRDRFGRLVLSFTGPDIDAIAARLSVLARLEDQRPHLARTGPRPVGLIRSDLEKALLARDETTALRLIAELRDTGRLNEENLKFLDVRLKAGLGQWEQIALDHWLIRNLSDLPLPPQTLADLVEALYRVNLDEAETQGDTPALLDAFRQQVFAPYPRLFASRHGVRTPRVVKAFILHESVQPRPSPQIIAALAELLPEDESAWAAPYLAAAVAAGNLAQEDSVKPEPGTSYVEQPMAPVVDEGEEAFDDGQFDRAFEIDLAKPLHRKSLSRLLSCVQFIGTDEARARLLGAFDSQPEIRDVLSASQMDRVEKLRSSAAPAEVEAESKGSASGWLDWARGLAKGQNPEQAALDALDHRTTWDTTVLRANAVQCAEFADIIGNLGEPAAGAVRQILPLIVSAFLPDEAPPAAATKPVAQIALMIVAMGDSIARSDLDVLSTVMSALLDLGLSDAEYIAAVQDLAAVQQRVASYANLAWSLDICEALAVAPAPTPEAISARLQLFLAVLGQCQGFAHRLSATDYLPIEYLAQDYGVEPASIAALRPSHDGAERAAGGADLGGKLIGIYTLTEAAGARAKAALHRLYPGCLVELNSDKVSTAALTNLARTADIFIFAWRSSSHQAFYCVKAALGGKDPIYAAGKGTASIVNAVREAAA